MKKLSLLAIDRVAGGCFSFFSTPLPVPDDIVM